MVVEWGQQTYVQLLVKQKSVKIALEGHASILNPFIGEKKGEEIQRRWKVTWTACTLPIMKDTSHEVPRVFKELTDCLFDVWRKNGRSKKIPLVQQMS